MGQEVSERDGFVGDESAIDIKKHVDKLTYSRDFLLSLSELKHCKQLPARLDPALLRASTSESVDGAIAIPASSSRGLIRGNKDRNHGHSESPPDVPEWRRPSSIMGNSFPQQSLKQADSNNASGKSGSLQRDGSGKTGHLRGDNVSSRNADRTASNRWEPRVAGGNKERERNHPRREWDSTESGGRTHGSGGSAHSGIVSQEHDGLLGSGGPIVQGIMHQARAHDKRQFSGRTSRMGRTGEQYQAVRGVKLRREDNDSINEETFGSEELNIGERTEQERQRRELFEQMRKEQRTKPRDIHKTPDDIWIWDSGQNNEPSSPGTPHSSSSKDDTFKARSKPVTTPSTPRLLIPPGFSKVALQKVNSVKESHESTKNTLSAIEDEIMHPAEQISLEDHNSKGKQEDVNIVVQEKAPLESKFAHWFPIPEHIMESSTHKDIPTNDVPNVETDGSFWSWESKYKSEVANTNDTFTRNSSSGLTEVRGHVTSSSTNDQTGGGIELSEIPGLGTTSPLSYLMPVKGQAHVLPMPNGVSLEDVERVMTATLHVSPVQNNSAVEDERYISQNHSLSAGHENFAQMKGAPVFLTCEDVEQSLLAQTFSSDNDNNFGTDMEHQDASNSITGERAERKIQHMFYSTDEVTENASQHIMSLLQKRNGGSSARRIPEESENFGALEVHKSQEIQSQGAEVVSLETLFGKTFANELRSVGEPVSSKLTDNSGNAAVRNGFQPLIDMFSSKQSDHFDSIKGGGARVAALSEREKLEVSKEPHIHDDRWSNTTLHREAQMENLTIENDSVKGPINALFGNDFVEPKLSVYAPHFPQSHYDGHYPSLQLPHEKPASPMHASHFIHEATSHGMGMYPQNRLHANFIQPNSPVQGQFTEGLDEAGYALRMPSFGPEPFHMGYHLNHHMLGHSGLDISVPSDGRSSRDLNQDIAGFQPYQHSIPAFFADRIPDYGNFGSGVLHQGNVHNRGSTLEKLMETREFPYARGVDGYMLSNRKPGYH